jgi:hypothetical protein
MPRSSRRRTALRLLSSDPLPPLPLAGDLLDAETPRRPGELHEPLVLTADAARRLRARAADAGLSVDIAASLLLEAGMLLERWPAAAGLTADGDPPVLALPEASARYLRSLTVARRPRRPSDHQHRTVAVPVRLVPRLTAAGDLERLIEAPDIEHAVALEVAAVLTGRTMSEWVVERLLLEG